MKIPNHGITTAEAIEAFKRIPPLSDDEKRMMAEYRHARRQTLGFQLRQVGLSLRSILRSTIKPVLRQFRKRSN